jgi:hypothetical protein
MRVKILNVAAFTGVTAWSKIARKVFLGAFSVVTWVNPIAFIPRYRYGWV